MRGLCGFGKFYVDGYTVFICGKLPRRVSGSLHPALWRRYVVKHIELHTTLRMIDGLDVSVVRGSL